MHIDQPVSCLKGFIYLTTAMPPHDSVEAAPWLKLQYTLPIASAANLHNKGLQRIKPKLS